MEATTHANGVTLKLEPGEEFFFKASALRGKREFNWAFPPKFPTGSIISRLLHGWYFDMRKVTAPRDGAAVTALGTSARGNFFSLRLEREQSVFVSPHCVAGFSGEIANLHTHIHLFGLNFWLLHRFFFPVFTRPGTILLYSRSPVVIVQDDVLQGTRILAFDIRQRFCAVTPNPSETASSLINLFSAEISWCFCDSGWVIAENHNDAEQADEERNPFIRFLLHLGSLLIP